MRWPVFLLALPLAAQNPVVNRPLDAASRPQRIERADKGLLADAFRLGAADEVWMIDAIRVWAMPAKGPACGEDLGDSIEKITLLGALDNPPVPGQPVCDCHALIPLAEIPLRPGSSASGNPNVTVTKQGGAWQLDFRNVRWSLPGGADVLFTVRATPRASASCPAGAQWSLAASPASSDYRLHRLNAKGVPVGLAEPAKTPRAVNVQVWARRSK